VAGKADFGPDLVLIDLMYVAAPGREFANAAQVDRPGVKIGVGRNSGADQFLSRTLKSAELVRPSGGGTEALRSGKADVWAANASNVQGVADALPGAKVVPGVSQPSGTRWRFRKEDHLRHRPNSPRSSTRQRKPV
jgi:polar amino acid transport system substrate-binding protein